VDAGAEEMLVLDDGGHLGDAMRASTSALVSVPSTTDAW